MGEKWEHREIVSIIARFTCSISEPNENNDEGADEFVSDEPKVIRNQGEHQQLNKSSRNQITC